MPAPYLAITDTAWHRLTLCPLPFVLLLSTTEKSPAPNCPQQSHRPAAPRLPEPPAGSRSPWHRGRARGAGAGGLRGLGRCAWLLPSRLRRKGTFPTQPQPVPLRGRPVPPATRGHFSTGRATGGGSSPRDPDPAAGTRSGAGAQSLGGSEIMGCWDLRVQELNGSGDLGLRGSGLQPLRGAVGWRILRSGSSAVQRVRVAAVQVFRSLGV